MSNVEIVGEALRQECLKIFGTTWNNDVAWRLARVAIAVCEKELRRKERDSGKRKPERKSL